MAYVPPALISFSSYYYYLKCGKKRSVLVNLYMMIASANTWNSWEWSTSHAITKIDLGFILYYFLTIVMEF